MVRRMYVVPFIRALARYRTLEFHIKILVSIYNSLNSGLKRNLREEIVRCQIEIRGLRSQIRRLQRALNITEDDLIMFDSVL